MAPRKRKAAAAAEPEVEDTAPAAKRARRVPPEPVPLAPVSHSSHGTQEGAIYVFGDGDCGQLGMGEDVTEKLKPAALDVDGKKVLQVVSGGMHTVALAADGTLYSWGVNDEGALGRETEGEAWKKSGKATGKGLKDPYKPAKMVVPKDIDTPVQISAGDSHTAVLTKFGSVFLCGTFRDASGVMGFSADTRIAVTLEEVLKPKKAEDQVIKIASGADHVVALTRGGAVITWGCGQCGCLGRCGARVSGRSLMTTYVTPQAVPLPKRKLKGGKIVDVTAGTYDTFVLTDKGQVWAFGLNNYGQLGADPDKAGNQLFAPTFVKCLDGKQIVAVGAGQHHTLALTKEGEVLSFGRPTYGRLGQKDAPCSSDEACPEPKPVHWDDSDMRDDGKAVVGIAGGLAVSGAFTDGDGIGYMWGFGTNNQLGNGDDDDDAETPSKLRMTKAFYKQKIVQLAIGGQHVALLCINRPGYDGSGPP